MGMCVRLVVVVTLLSLTYESLSFEIRKPFPLVEAISNSAEFRVSNEARETLGNVSLPISVVSVIGPKNSGKSYFLNKLVGLSCREGFQVGNNLHNRKGVWGVLVDLQIEGARDPILFLDTNAVDRVGISDFYDDRISAIATVMSSVLIYNLPETIYEIDLDRLSFAFELAQKFYSRVKGPDVPFELPKLIWLIQRAFIEEKSVQQLVHDALLTVPNYQGNKNIEMVNQILDSIALMGTNITGFSLPQPHHDRSNLCDIPDDVLNQTYVEQISQIVPLSISIIHPKTILGQALHGNEFLSLLDQILVIANKVKIPFGKSLVDDFNQGVVEQCLQLYLEKMAGLHMPVQQHEVQGHHESSINEAKRCFQNQHLGKSLHETKLLLNVEEETHKVYRYLVAENEYQSVHFCEGTYKRCVDSLEAIPLPSLDKIAEGSKDCKKIFEQQCIGPAKDYYEQQVTKLLQNSWARAMRVHDDRLRCIAVAIGGVLVAVIVMFGVATVWRRKEKKSNLELLPVYRSGADHQD